MVVGQHVLVAAAVAQLEPEMVAGLHNTGLDVKVHDATHVELRWRFLDYE